MAWRRAIETFGTAYIFERRVAKPRQRLQWLAYLGLAVPVSVGGMAMAFGVEKDLLAPALVVAGVLSLVQALLALWALTSKWDDSLSYGLESTRANHRLASQFEQLATHGPADISTKLDLLEATNQARIDSDLGQGITDAERRMGMRSGLRQYRRACAECGQVPTSLDPSKCNTCGNF
jgi:mobilome CxxCx(11)CxxC protein